MININTKEELTIIDIQIITSIIFIFTIIVSIFLSIKKKEEILGKKSDLNTIKIQQINRIIILILLVMYFYCSYKQTIIDKEKGIDLKGDYIEIIVSILSLIGGLLILYEVFYINNQNDDIENPII